MVLSISTLLALTASGLLAGLVGALVGVGGGIIVVPTLVIGFGLDIKIAVAASLVAVVASSTAASSVYVGKGLSNMRLGMILEVATTLGGICGGLLAVWIAPDLISMIFGALLVFIAGLMLRDSLRPKTETPVLAASSHASSLGGEYYDDFQKRTIAYNVRRLPLGFAVSYFAGILSGLLGVGGGFIKVPAMNMGMNVPMKVATATSNLMIGVTAISSLFVYFARGFVQPLIAAPVAVGVVGGALLGTKIAARISPKMLKRVFSILLFFIAIQMILRSAGVLGGH
ncbi:MAG: sulfite exporter TauE/SafE family protein [Bdellovibrionaceae bacterium]|nr:sulfite exporter TauE/SafE family protein [Pseudobdellovibrionaceae bacterium]